MSPATGQSRSLYLAAVLLLSAASSAQTTSEAWQEHRDSMLRDAALLRYYTFETAGDGAEVPNLAGEAGALSYAVQSGPQDPLSVVEGRWPGKKAVHLDRGYLAGEPFVVANRQFTVEAWVRVSGPGAVHGDAASQTGTLLSVGIGFWDGWRITMSYPDRLLGFEMGRPAPVNAFMIRTGPVPDRVWHHLAAVWDGRQMRLCLNGLVVARGDYPGDYTPPKPGAQLRLGFAGYGWGSCGLDIDEVAVYERALSPTDLLRHACFASPLADAEAERFAECGAAAEARELPAAAAGFAALAKLPHLAPDFQAAARVQWGQALLAQQKPAEALSALMPVIDMPAVSQGLRAMAMAPLRQLATQTADAPVALYEALLNQAAELTPREVAQLRLQLARRYAAEGEDAEAKRQFEEVLSMADLSGRERLDVLLQAGHAAAQSGDYEAARRQYGALMAVPDALPQYRSLAQLCLARTFGLQRNWAKAKGAYALVAELEGVPQSHVWEAEDCLGEIERLQAGRPARDPQASRVSLPKRPKPAVELYVGPEGSDEGPGTRARPFVTLLAARDAIRALRQAGLPKGGVQVTVLPGTYTATETLALEAGDSGTEEAPIVYRAESSGSVTFTGGSPVTGFQPVTDAAILGRLPEEARGKVLCADLRAQGITDLGQVVPMGMGRPMAPVTEVYFNGRPLQPARWPNEGFVKTGKVLDAGVGNPPRGAVFTYDGDRPTRWQEAKDPWLYGYFRWLWADDAVPVASIDTQNRQLTTALPTGYAEVIEGAPYYVFNLLEEIDQPGEWYLDRNAGLLYLYPPSDPAQAEVSLSVFSQPFVTMDGASWVTLEGFTFELGRLDGILLRGSEHCLIAGCTVRRIAGTAVTIDGGASNGVLSCDLHTLGRNGTWVKGGDRRTLTPGGHFVENCHIHDFSRLWRTYTPAFWTDGVGNRFVHNLVHDSPGHAMRIEGDEHVIELNEVHRVCMETDDQGALDMWYNPTYRGVAIRYNYWHDIGSENGLGQAGVRLDDAICNVLIYGNVFERCSRNLFGGVQIHGGKDNVIENNVFAECRFGISFSGWGPERWKQVIESADVQRKAYEEVDINQPPRSTRYPDLGRMAEGEGINLVWRNVAYNCGEFLTRDRGIQDLMDNQVTTVDPGFVDAARGNYALKPDAPWRKGGAFRPVPFEEIGLYEDGLRPTP
jgi:tetratricopeptide (TPR) repeat protein